MFPFVCELCTVRANVGKELLDFHNDHRFLISLERMRMIDMFNCWARNTLVNYKSALRSLTTFQSRFGLNILNPQTPIQSFSQPSTDPAIAFGWAVLYKSILPSAQAKGDTVGFMSLRLLRSASVAYNTFVTALLQPQNHYRDRNNRLLQSNSIAPQENIASQLFLAGLAVRKGTESTKGKPLLHRHFIWNQRYRENLYQKCPNNTVKLEIVTAQCIELAGYQGFLRSSETTGLEGRDLFLVPPSKGLEFDLPPRVGMICFKLLPSTKTSRSAQADVVMAWATSGGLFPGLWFSRLLQLLQLENRYHLHLPIFVHRIIHKNWTTAEYVTHHLLPLLRLQQPTDPYLARFVDTDPELCLSTQIRYHSLRLSGLTSATIGDGGIRKCTEVEGKSKGRWRQDKKNSGDASERYRQPPYKTRVVWQIMCA